MTTHEELAQARQLQDTADAATAQRMQEWRYAQPATTHEAAEARRS